MWESHCLEKEAASRLQLFLFLRRGALRSRVKLPGFPLSMTQPAQREEARPRTLCGKGRVLFNEISPGGAASFPLVLNSSSSWDHPTLSYFKAVLMFYDSLPSFLLGKKKKSQPRHLVSGTENSWRVIWRHVFYCEWEDMQEIGNDFCWSNICSLSSLYPGAPAPTHTYTPGLLWTSALTCPIWL